MAWSFRSDQPIYTQMAEKIRLEIVSGAYRPGERLASVRDMALEAGVNPNTLQRALQELEREGMVRSQRTSGRFVTEDLEVIAQTKKHFAEQQVKRFLDAMGRLGFRKNEIIALLEEVLSPTEDSKPETADPGEKEEENGNT